MDVVLETAVSVSGCRTRLKECVQVSSFIKGASCVFA